MQSLTILLVVACVLGATLSTASPFVSEVRNSPARSARDNQRHGEVSGHVQRDKGVGTSVHVNGRGDAWVSRDGNSRVTVDGHYGQVVHGPAKGGKDYGAGVNFEHKF